MAKRSSKLSIFFNLALVLSLLLIISTMAESRLIFNVIKASSKVSCDSVIGVKSGETCTEIAAKFKLSTTVFDAINPNINCSKIFVGQWVCIDGSVN
ncbi:hypothetical protein ABFX02_08G143200 [Erythranthe guttata]